MIGFLDHFSKPIVEHIFFPLDFALPLQFDLFFSKSIKLFDRNNLDVFDSKLIVSLFFCRSLTKSGIRTKSSASLSGPQAQTAEFDLNRIDSNRKSKVFPTIDSILIHSFRSFELLF
jgi:hypothetical protein